MKYIFEFADFDKKKVTGTVALESIQSGPCRAESFYIKYKPEALKKVVEWIKKGNSCDEATITICDKNEKPLQVIKFLATLNKVLIHEMNAVSFEKKKVLIEPVVKSNKKMTKVELLQKKIKELEDAADRDYEDEDCNNYFTIDFTISSVMKFE